MNNYTAYLIIINIVSCSIYKEVCSDKYIELLILIYFFINGFKILNQTIKYM